MMPQTSSVELDGRGCIALLYAVLRRQSADAAVIRAGVGCSAKRHARKGPSVGEFHVHGAATRVLNGGQR